MSRTLRRRPHFSVIAAPVFIALILWAVSCCPYQDKYIICSKSHRIYTVDDQSLRVECMLIWGKRIQDTGNYDDIKRRRFCTVLPQHIIQRIPKALFPFMAWLHNTLSRIKIIQIDSNAIIVPGLADAHAHIMDNGWQAQLPLAGADSVQEVIHLIKTFIEKHPDVLSNKTAWIEGMGWDQTRWLGKSFPTADDLDADPLLHGRPIALSRVDGHACWVSPRVLELMASTEAIPDVEGGLVVRDDHGKPTGVFVDNAMGLIPSPPWSEVQLETYFQHTMREALSHGLTSIHDASTSLDAISFLQKKADKSDIPMHLYLMGHVPQHKYWGSSIPHLTNYGPQERLTVKSIKLIFDGALGSWGAAMLEPYSDNLDERGLLLIQPETLRQLVHQFHEDGFQVNVHCIGDRANQIVLDIFEEIIEGGGNVTEWRPRIEHAQILTHDDIIRIQHLGVIASVQPTHATSDMRFADSRIGPNRITGAYAYQTLLRGSPMSVLPLGSDFPVEAVNPIFGFYAAITRLDADGWSPHGPGGWFPEERLTRSQALKGMTLDAAYASFAEDEIGSLVVGKRADFVVLDRDIMDIDVQEILSTQVLATVIDGKVVYGSLSL